MSSDSDLEITRLHLLEQLDEPDTTEILIDDLSSTTSGDLQPLLYPTNDTFKLKENEEILTLSYGNLAICPNDAKNPTGLKDANPLASPLTSFHAFIGNVALKSTADELIELQWSVSSM